MGQQWWYGGELGDNNMHQEIGGIHITMIEIGDIHITMDDLGDIHTTMVDLHHEEYGYIWYEVYELSDADKPL